MSEAASIHVLMSALMRDVEAIGKGRRNKEQGFAFRGIDDVMNALHDKLVTHGIYFLPQVQERIAETRATAKGGTMNVCHLRVRFVFYGPAGDSVFAEAWGEAADSGDKATGKAHSMALKTALLEALCIPTEDMGDADEHAVEAAGSPEDAARERIRVRGESLGLDVAAIVQDFASLNDGQHIKDAALSQLDEYEKYLHREPVSA